MRACFSPLALRLGSLLLALGFVPAALADVPGYISVSGGAHARRETLVSVLLPNGWRHYTHVQAPGGQPFPLQVAKDGQACFILPKLNQGEITLLTLRASSPAKDQEPRVRAASGGTGVLLTIAGRGEVLAYRAAKGVPPRADIKPSFSRGGYLHPITSPSGRVVTDDYPAGHPHHHGLWFAWVKTQFQERQPNFWDPGAGTGTVEAGEVGELVSGPVWGGFEADHRFVDLTGPAPKVALAETWTVRVYDIGAGERAYYLFDLVSRQVCGSPLRVAEHLYGGLGVRGNALWRGSSKAAFLTSDGVTDRVKGNQSRARWCYMGGEVQGRQTGLAILCHPSNFRAPQPLRLHPDEPFVSLAPAQVGEFAIVPGSPYVSRYRAVVFDGPPDQAELDRLWNDYAYPPTASVVMPGS